MKPTSTVAIALGCILVFAGCAKDGENGPAGAAGPALTGNITGFVNLFDQYGGHILLDNDSSLVAMDGTSNASYTDSLGCYLFSNVQTGIYNLTCTHVGFGTTKVNSLQFTGGGDLYRDIRLSAIPSFQVDSISIASTPGMLTLIGHLPTDVQQRTVLVFVGSAANTSADPATYLTFYNKNVMPNQGNFNIQVPATDLNALGLTTGETVYFAAYASTTTFNNSSSYQDLNTGRTVFTAISANAAVGNALVP